MSQSRDSSNDILFQGFIHIVGYIGAFLAMFDFIEKSTRPGVRIFWY
jgi:hypothetical protein